ncbi:MAG: hypothetical protein QOI94_2622, partial [Acidobacteriaceae bacterium]|nr:hypothetical protein [Acidobacteriaceae bacterium]
SKLVAIVNILRLEPSRIAFATSLEFSALAGSDISAS